MTNKYLFYNYLPILADHILDIKYNNRKVHHSYPPFIIDNIKEGDTIFVKTDLLPMFFKQICPRIKKRFYLLTGVAGLDIQEHYKIFIEQYKIIKWIGCNILFDHEKVFKIPIGFAENEQEEGNQLLLDELYNNKIPLDKKINKILITPMGNTHDDRNNILSLFNNKDYCNILKNRIPFKEFMNEINRFKFVLCPRGRGTDTHRFWEILLMGSIPIVEKSGLDTLYKQFPCIIVDSYSDINSDLINQYKIDNELIDNIDKFLVIDNFYNMINNIKSIWYNFHL